MGALGSPAQPHGQVLKTALPPPRSPRRRQPPSVIFHLIPLYSSPPITDKRQRPGIPRFGLPLSSCRAPASLWKSVSRKDHLDMHRRSQAAVNFHSPLPAAALPAPRCSCSDELCAWVCDFPPLPSPLPTPSLVLLTGSHTHPPNSTSEEHVEKQKMK